MKILSSFTHSHVVPDVYDFLSQDEHKQRFLFQIMQDRTTSETTQSEHEGQV